ncbi:MAG: efflux RND transporter periplasmic adaptor subunit [Ignavibacteriales bacterium]
MANGAKKKNKKKILIFGGIGVLLLIIVILVLTSGDKEAIVSVQTEKVAKRTITQTVTATGKIHPQYQVELRPEVSGEVVSLPVEEGDVVHKGQLLVRIKPEQYIAQRNQAKAQLEAARAQLKVREAALSRVESDYKRIKGLAEKGLASDQELEMAKSEYLQNVGLLESQKASVQQALENLNNSEEQLSKTAIYSPIDGRVTARIVELNERVLGSSFSMGSHLMTVADLRNMEARVDVDENDVVLVSIGDTAEVEVDAFGDKKFKGIVTQIGNSAQTTGLGTQDEVVNFQVRIRIIDPEFKLRPGMSCDAEIKTETRKNVLSVPIQSVTARLDKPVEKPAEDDENGSFQPSNNNSKNKPKEVVFVVENGKAKKIEVETGISDDSYIEIKKGLKENQEVVSGPYRAISKELNDGTIVMLPKTKKDVKKKK